eukprot:scaffold205535_cov35-Tisochrysis_lutea.AAC.5
MQDKAEAPYDLTHYASSTSQRTVPYLFLCAEKSSALSLKAVIASVRAYVVSETDQWEWDT